MRCPEWNGNQSSKEYRELGTNLQLKRNSDQDCETRGLLLPSNFAPSRAMNGVLLSLQCSSLRTRRRRRGTHDTLLEGTNHANEARRRAIGGFRSTSAENSFGIQNVLLRHKITENSSQDVISHLTTGTTVSPWFDT